jgi:molecular chaperone HscA
MKIHVLQGERELVENCRSLAEFNLTNIPPKPSGSAVVEVTFNIDADGILTVSAKEETTGVQQQIEVRPSYGLDSDSMEKMLLASMEQAKEDIFNRLLREAVVDAGAVIKTLESGLRADKDIISEEYYNKIKKQIEKVKTLCDQDNREAIEAEAKYLDELASDFADERISKALKSYLGGKKVYEI